jgi:hypothetical protein
VAAARESGDSVLISSALDALSVAQLLSDDAAAAAATAVGRIEPLLGRTRDPAGGLELKDAYHTAAMMLLAAGDARGSLECARGHRDLPFLRAERDLAAEELFAPAALSGDWEDALSAAEGYRRAWERSGAPAAAGRAIAPAALALIFGLRRDDEAAAGWRAIAAAMRGEASESPAPPAYIRVFGAVLALDRGRPNDALAMLGEPGRDFYDLLLASWHAALAAEAAVLAGDVRADELLGEAQAITNVGSIPALITDRAFALWRSGHIQPTAAGAFAALGAPYQAERCHAMTRAGSSSPAAAAAPGLPTDRC